MIKELIKKLEKENPNNEVFISSDAEGNNFHGIDSVANTKKNKTIIWADDTYIESIY